MNFSVIMISANFYPYIGGTEKQTLEVSRALKSRGARVLVLTQRIKGLPSQEEVEGLFVRRLACWGTGTFGRVVFMFSSFFYLLLHAGDYQILHVHLASSPAVIAALVGKILGKKVVVKLGGGKGCGEIARSRGTFLGRLKLRAFGFLRPVFVAVSPGQIEELNGFGLEKLQVALIPNGVNIKKYCPISAEEKNKLRDKYGWKGLVFLYVGRFDSDKRQPELLKIFLEGWSGALQQGFRGLLFLVGQGPKEKTFQELIHRAGVEESVRILGAWQDVSSLYQAADVFVLPTISEGLSNALLEAMASGLPILASCVSGTKEILEGSGCGFLFDPFSPQEVVRHLKEISENSRQLTLRGQKAREIVVSRFSLNQTVETLMRFYQ